MNRVKKVFTAIHVVLWTFFSLLVTLQLVKDKNPYWLTVTAGFVITCLYVFYGHFLLLTHYPGKKHRRLYLLRLALIIVTGPLVFSLFHYLKDHASDVIEYYAMALFSIVPIFVFLSWLARVTENLVLNTIQKEQLEKQAVEAELNYLRSQINPHFLFNTLNNIHTLVYKQAVTAPEAVLRLASLMRYMIYESNAPMVPISSEISYLEDYMALQQLRYKAGPVVDLKSNVGTAACEIAPLLFIHLVENAYKHSPARLAPGDIKLIIRVVENKLTFTIQNPIDGKPASALEEPGGIGLQNVRKRLGLLYPGRHTLEIDKTTDTFTVTLRISGL